MKTALLISAAAAGLAAAQTSVTTLFLPQFDQQIIDGSVIAVGGAAITYFLACPPGTDSTDCGLGPGVTLTEGPSMMVMTYDTTMTMSGQVEQMTYGASCVIQDKDTAVCTELVASNFINAMSFGMGATQSVDTFTGLSSFYLPVTLTAGLEKLSGSGGGSTTATATGSASGGKATTTATGSASARAPASTGSSGAASSSSSSSSSSTAGVPRVTQQAVLAGVAAVVGGVMMV